MLHIGKAIRLGVLPAATAIVMVVAVLAVMAQVLAPSPAAESQARDGAPTDVFAHNGDNIGEVIVSWTPAAGADRNRVGWANIEEVLTAQAAGDWLEAFNFADLGGAKSSYTAKRLAPGVRHAFIVATLTTGGAIIYSDWVFVTTVAAPPVAACPTPTPTPTLAPPPIAATPASSEPTIIGQGHFHKTLPVWSPDGGKIAFLHLDATSYDVYTMNADGSSITRLTDHDENDHRLAWSPDGRKIAFSSNRGVRKNIYIMNADGSDVTRITDGGDVHWYDYPAWSPDGKRIAFSSNRDGGRSGEIYLMNADGSGIMRLTDSPGYDTSPAWSPDGRRIVFTSYRHGGFDGEIYVMTADGSNVTRLTHNPGVDGPAAWSPDGRQIAFRSRRGGIFGIYVMNSDGSEITSLVTDYDLADVYALDNYDLADVYAFSSFAWSPDGRIAFSFGGHIYVMPAPH